MKKPRGEQISDANAIFHANLPEIVKFLKKAGAIPKEK